MTSNISFSAVEKWEVQSRTAFSSVENKVLDCTSHFSAVEKWEVQSRTLFSTLEKATDCVAKKGTHTKILTFGSAALNKSNVICLRGFHSRILLIYFLL